jgi:hypothetical protein
MKKRTLLLILEGLMFAYCGISLFYFVWFFIQDFGSDFAFLTKYIPFYLVNIIPVHLLFVLHLSLHPVSYKRKKLMLMVNGAVVAAGGFLTSLSIAILLFRGTYPSIIMGGVSYLYPLDDLILGLIYSICGFFIYFYGRTKYTGLDDAFPVKRDPIGLLILRDVFRPLYVLIALFFMGDLMHFFVTLDYTGINAGAMMSVYLLMILPLVGLGLYEYGYLEAPAAKKPARQLVYSVSLTAAALILTAWFWIGETVRPDFITESGMALFPIDFMKSIPFGPFFLFALAYSAPLAAFIRYLMPEKTKKPVRLPK